MATAGSEVESSAGLDVVEVDRPIERHHEHLINNMFETMVSDNDADHNAKAHDEHERFDFNEVDQGSQEHMFRR